MQVVGRRQQSRGPRRWAVAPRPSAARSGCRPRTAAPQPVQRWTSIRNEPDPRPDDGGQIDDRGVLDAVRDETVARTSGRPISATGTLDR